jgi:hypothetical protein
MNVQHTSFVQVVLESVAEIPDEFSGLICCLVSIEGKV